MSAAVLVWAILLSTPLVSAVLPIAICTGLNASLAHLRATEIADHAFPAALHEPACVYVNPCTARRTSADGVDTSLAVPAETWLWRNSTALALPHDAASSPTAVDGRFDIEFARVPSGVVVETCEPDFSQLRYGRVECNANTLVRIDGQCPREDGRFSLLECVEAAHANAVQIDLAYRPLAATAAFGSLSWNAACDGVELNPQAARLCELLRYSYVLPLKYAAPATRTQLVRWRLADGYACDPDVPPGSQLSRAEPPHRLQPCPTVEHAEYTGNGCEFSCLPGYVKENGQCNLGCDYLTRTACNDGEYDYLSCDANGIMYYACEECPVQPGKRVVPWSAERAGLECAYSDCPAGQYMTGDMRCEDCAPHTFSAAPLATQCDTCNYDAGLYQPAAGQTACVACFSDRAPPDCPAGTQQLTNVARINSYFAPDGPGANRANDMLLYCLDGGACLPCPPGSYAAAENSETCTLCATGSFQPNWQATACVACAEGHNTTRLGATSNAECDCLPGYTPLE